MIRIPTAVDVKNQLKQLLKWIISNSRNKANSRIFLQKALLKFQRSL